MTTLIQEILAANNVSAPEGVPLYRYRLAAGQRERLQAELRARCQRQVTFPLAAAPLFCLHAADHLRRAGSGVWAWRTVAESVEWGGGEHELRVAVQRGMGWWRRPLITTPHGTRYLATLIAEGGGPLGLLRDPAAGGPLRAFLRRLLADRERFHRSAHGFVEHLETLLPMALRRAVVLDLFAHLIDAVAELRSRLRDAGLGATPNPVTALDARVPGWRDRLALDLQDEVAGELLRGLLREPAPAAAIVGELPTVVTCLRRGQGTAWSITRELAFPERAIAETMLAAFGVLGQGDAAPSRLRLLVERSDGTRVFVAAAVLCQGSTPFYAFERNGQSGVEALDEIREGIVLHAMAGTREVGRFSPPGGEALGDGPWTFSADPHGRLLGTASVRSRDEQVHVVWEEAQPPHLEEATVWEPQGMLTLADKTRAVCAMRGKVLFGDLRISTSQQFDDDHWCLDGRRWHGPGRIEGEVFVGAPVARTLDHRGISRSATPGNLWWRRDGSAPRVLASASSIGRGVIEVHDHGDIVLRRRVLLLPPDLEIALRASPRHDEGTVTVKGGTVQELGVDTVAGLVVERRAPAQGFEIGVRRDSAAIASIRLTLRLRGGPDIRILTPFPGRRSGFVRGFDVDLPNGTACALEELAQIRAVAWPHNDAERFRLVARIPTTSWLPLAVLPETSGRRELVLDAVADDLAALLAQTDEIDAHVEVGVECSGHDAAPRMYIKVRRYGRHLDLVRAPERCSLSLASGGVAAALPASSFRLDALPLLEPQAEAEVIPRTEQEWHFDFSERNPGPWLVLGWREGRLALRPLLITVRPPEGTQLPIAQGLRGAASVPDRRARMAALQAKVQVMVGDPSDPDWTWIDDHVATLQALPAVTYDVVRALVAVDDAAVTALLRAAPELRPFLWKALETLPFAWSLVPTRAWSEALGRVRDAWPRLGEVSMGRTFDAWFEDLIAFADARSRTLRVQLEIAANRCGHDYPKSTLRTAQRGSAFCLLMRGMLEESAIRLRQRHAPELEWWPDFDLTPWLAQIPAGERLVGHHPFQDLVIHAPLLAAGISLGRVTTDVTVALRTALRRARAFDEAWFDDAAVLWLSRLTLCVLH